MGRDFIIPLNSERDVPSNQKIYNLKKKNHLNPQLVLRIAHCKFKSLLYLISVYVLSSAYHFPSVRNQK